MTPKEKARELVEKMTFSCHECDTQWKAKQCALIAVDEIIKTLKPPCLTEFDYWQEVKQEIFNL